MKRQQTIQNAFARTFTKIPKRHHITPVLKSLHLAKSPSTHPLQNCISYNTFKTSEPSCIRLLLTIQPPESTRSSLYLSLYRPPVSSSLKFCNHSISYKLHKLFGTSSHKTSVSLRILLTHLLT